MSYYLIFGIRNRGWSDAYKVLPNRLFMFAALPSVVVTMMVLYVQVAYTNPENGKSAEHIIGFSCIMLRPNETVELAKRSCAMAFHIIDGNINMHIKNVDEVLDFNMTRLDTSVAPCFAEINLTNRSHTPSYVFVADEASFRTNLMPLPRRNFNHQ